MRTYLEHLEYVLGNGTFTEDRTGTGTYSVFGAQMRFDLSEGFPLLTTKKLHWKSIVHELLWFLKGDTNIAYLNSHGVSIWNEWSDEDGNLGPVYGYQWRWWGRDLFLGSPGIDQITNLVREIKTNPTSRRLIVSAWNVGELDYMALPPCHMMFQVKILDGKLHLHMYQRSADLFLGVPFNIASYALLTHMLAHVTGYEVGDLIISFGDMHLYTNHMDQVCEQLTRFPGTLPRIQLNQEVKSIFDFKFEDITLIGYDPLPSIKAPVAV